MAGLELFANQATTTVSSGGTTAPAPGTVQTWTVASSAGFPAASNATTPTTFFRITDPDSSTEKMLVTNVSGTTWTVTRGADGTTPVAHTAGFRVENVLTALALENFIQAGVYALAPWPSGDATGATDLANLTAALAALPSGGTLFIPAVPNGTPYLVNGPVPVQSGQSIVGLGQARSGNAAVIKQANGANMTAPGTPALNGRGLWISGTSYSVHDAVLLPIAADNFFFPSANDRGNFTASTAYAVNDVVFNPTGDNLCYICISAYTSSSTRPDQDAVHWQRVATQVFYCTTALTSTTTPDVDTSHWAAAGVTGLIASQEWISNTASDGSPTVIQNVQLDGNWWLNPYSTCCGAVLQSFWTSFRDCLVQYVSGYGLLLTDKASGGATVASAGSENMITGNKFWNSNRDALRSVSATSGNNEDGFFLDNFVSGTGLAGVNIDCLGGWMIRGNHFYGIGGNAIAGSVGFATHIIDNYIEDFGNQNASTVYYQGIGVIQVNGRASYIGRNFVGCLEPNVNTSHYQYIAVTAGTSQNFAQVVITDNSVTGTFAFAANAIGLVLQVNSGGDLFAVTEGNQISGMQTETYIPAGTTVASRNYGSLTLFGNLALAAGTATVPPVTFASGTLETTAAAGAAEYDGTAFYLTAQASSRQVVDTEQLITLTSGYTLTSQTAAQKLFNSTANGALTVQGSTTYWFECFFTLSSMSSSSGSFGFAFGGTATLTAQLWETEGNKATLATAANAQNTVNTTANTTIVTATTATVGWAKVWGKVRVNAAGTLIPQVSLGVAAAAVVGADSYFRIWPAGASSVTSVGNWS